MILGILGFSRELLCKREVLGSCFKAKIADTEYTLTFPRCPSISVDGSSGLLSETPYLISPHEKNILNKHEDPLKWGYIVNSATGDARISHIVISTPCDDEKTIDGVSDSFSKSIKQWEKSFMDYCVACTGQGSARDYNRTYSKCTWHLTYNRVPVCCTNYEFFIHFDDPSHSLSRKQIEDAIAFSSSNSELLPEYQMLVAAYHAKENCNNRQLIIDASSAAEFCLLRYIRNYCEDKKIEGGILTNKYRVLGDRFKLVKQIDPNFPSIDWENKIVKTRNAVAHPNKIEIPAEEADLLLEEVEKLLVHYHKEYYEAAKGS